MIVGGEPTRTQRSAKAELRISAGPDAAPPPGSVLGLPRRVPASERGSEPAEPPPPTVWAAITAKINFAEPRHPVIARGRAEVVTATESHQYVEFQSAKDEDKL